MVDRMGPEHPKAMYKDGGAELIEGNPVMTRIVHSAEEEGEALADGWRLSPAASDEVIAPRRGRPPKVRD